MDLGCIDMGCIEKRSKETSPDKENSPSDSVMSASKGGKSSVLNKFTSQIKKPPHRKSSPLNWFPRKKVDSYLKRKIKLLQEVDGMNSTLDETLGDSNPHYSRVLREKIAVREAAHKAMEARKAALVEASWCRILQAARIESKEAEAQLLKAEECAAKALEAATAIGVIMHDIPDCQEKHYKIETSAPRGGTTTHTIEASFETAFEVDKQVAAAVKSAFTKLANCPSISKDDFKELLSKISEHPDTDESYPEMSEFSSECESDTGAELELGLQKDSSRDYEQEYAGVRQKKYKKRQVFEKFKMTNLVEMMLERLQGLHEDELASLATIVATCGLNAALAEADNSRTLGSAADYASTLDASNRISSFRAGRTRNSNTNGHVRRKMPDSELPSLDKFLVKRLTRLEREVLQAKKARSSEQARDKSQDENFHTSDNTSSVRSNSDLGSVIQKPSSKFEKEIEDAKRNSGMICNYESKKSESDVISDVPDFGSMLMKHTSKLEKEIAEAKRKNGLHETDGKKFEKKTVARAKDVMEVPSLDKVLVKHMSRLEKEVQEAKNRRFFSQVEGKENIDQNKNETNAVNLLPQDCSICPSEPLIGGEPFLKAAEALLLDNKDETSRDGENSLGEVRSLERKKMQEPSSRTDHVQRHQRKQGENCSTDCEGLDKILVKHVSRLEKEKLEIHAKDEGVTKVKRREDIRKELEMSECSLDQVLVKHRSRLEREKMAAAQQPDNQIRHSTARREARERELQETWGGLSLGMSEGNLDQVLVKHRSRLEREKMSAAQEPDNQIRHSTTRREAREKELQETWGGLGLGNSIGMGQGNLDQVLVKHKPRLEREKMSAAQEPDNQIRHSTTRREAREKELQETWGGLGLGNSIGMGQGNLDQVLVKHRSRLEREKMAAAQEPDNQIRHSTTRQEAREKELQETWGGLGLGNSLGKGEGNLDQVLVKHKSRLEREKMSAAQEPDNQIRHSTTRREAREKEMQEAWGGLGLGNSICPHLSRLERDKAAWLKAEEDEKRKGMEV